MFKLAVLVSGGGSNLQAIIDSIKDGKLNCKIEMVISDREGAYGLERARINNIPAYLVDRKIYGSETSDKIYELLNGKVDLIVLAGFLSILKGDLIAEFKNRIINIHPSLIPAFCGNGMHGMNVHRSAIEYGVKFSGCTVHFVDEGTDTGPIILQKVVPVYDEDTPEILQKRILVEEHKALPEAIGMMAEGKIKVNDRKVMGGKLSD